jgi:hypothetical protein
MKHQSIPIPEAIAQLQRQLDQFRSTRPRRTKLPESLWQAAVELARHYGVHPVARPLRLDYTRLKQRLGGTASPRPAPSVRVLAGAQARPSAVADPRPEASAVSSPRSKSARPAFVELLGAHAAALEEHVIEFESSYGSKMRIRWKAAAPPDWAGLLRAWREVEG